MRVLISGGGIAGLTLAVLLKKQGIEPIVVEREPRLGATGYMMDFFGTGWDVAERMGLVAALRAVRYPIERMEFVSADGEPYCTVPIERVRSALDNRYVYLRRSDLEKILFDRAREVGVEVRFGASIDALDDDGACVHVRFADEAADHFDLVVGADGVHSKVREIVFGPEQQFARYLGYYAAAFHFGREDYGLDHAFKLYEETDRTVWLYPIDAQRADATMVFRQAEIGHVPREQRPALLRARFANAGWVAQKLLRELEPAEPVFLDSLTQIVMPDWHCGRVVLVGDACGCLTLAAGQGSQIAMAGAWVLARELSRRADHGAAFRAYQDFLKPHVVAKQRDAARFAKLLVPSAGSWGFLRRLGIRLMFSAPLLRPVMKFFGTTSLLAPAAALSPP
jgi:2-polyprenyl-6-methoxyphenol hydroxylase-like FAD-dependent oxidoreductase